MLLGVLPFPISSFNYLSVLWSWTLFHLVQHFLSISFQMEVQLNFLFQFFPTSLVCKTLLLVSCTDHLLMKLLELGGGGCCFTQYVTNVQFFCLISELETDRILDLGNIYVEFPWKIICMHLIWFVSNKSDIWKQKNLTIKNVRRIFSMTHPVTQDIIHAIVEWFINILQ